jgi:hypothetical protein
MPNNRSRGTGALSGIKIMKVSLAIVVTCITFVVAVLATTKASVSGRAGPTRLNNPTRFTKWIPTQKGDRFISPDTATLDLAP